MKLYDSLSRLREKGKRLTPVRSSLVRLFETRHGPFSAPELIACLIKQGLRVNKTTVYRELEFLLNHAVVREVNLGERQARYELADPGHHHHHLVCLKCREVDMINLPNDLETHERAIKKTKGFAVSRHALEFFGLCAQCQG